MDNFAAVNKAYDGFFEEPKPVSSCVGMSFSQWVDEGTMNE